MKIQIVTILIVLVTVYTSCKKNDAPSVKQKLNPPSWIIGEWLVDGSHLGYRFTSDDMVSITAFHEVSLKKNFESATVVESITDSSYRVDATIDQSTFKYYFKYVSATEIEDKTPAFVNFTRIYIKQ